MENDTDAAPKADEVEPVEFEAEPDNAQKRLWLKTLTAYSSFARMRATPAARAVRLRSTPCRRLRTRGADPAQRSAGVSMSDERNRSQRDGPRWCGRAVVCRDDGRRRVGREHEVDAASARGIHRGVSGCVVRC